MAVSPERAREDAAHPLAGAASRPEAEANAPAPATTETDGGGAVRTEVVLSKLTGERSFGMSLVLDRLVRNAEFAVVNCVVPRSPACRAGLREGWVVLQINGQSARGRTVHDVAKMFRDLPEVAITAEMRQRARVRPVAVPSAIPRAAPLPQPSIASDGFEIIEVRPGNASATPHSNHVLQPQPKPEQLPGPSAQQPRQHSEQSATEMTAQAKGSSSSLLTSPKQVVVPGAAIAPAVLVKPKMAAKSMRHRPIAEQTAAPAQGCAPAAAATAASAATAGNAAARPHGTVSTRIASATSVSTPAPRVAEPKQAEARDESAGGIVGSNNSLQTPTALPDTLQTSNVQTAKPVVGKHTIVTPVLHLHAIPGGSSTAAQDVFKATAPTVAPKTSAPPLRLQGTQLPTPTSAQAVPSASASASLSPLQPQRRPAAEPVSAQVKRASNVEKAVDSKLPADAAVNAAASTKPASGASMISQPLRQSESTATRTVPAASADEYEEKAPIRLAPATEDEHEEKAPISGAAATQPGSAASASLAMPAPVSTPSDQSTLASRQSASTSSAPKRTAPSVSPAAAASSASAVNPRPSRTTKLPQKPSPKPTARAPSSGRKAPSKTAHSLPPPVATMTEEVSSTPSTGPRPLPLDPSPARGKKRGRPKKAASSASKASRRDSAGSPAAQSSADSAPTTDPGMPRFQVPKEEYTDLPIEMYQHLLFQPLGDSDGGTPGGNRRRNASRRARPRHSLTVERLEAMGFRQEEAEMSIASCGEDLEQCMVWIVSHREEIMFNDDLNRASIESERSKRNEELRTRQAESETLRNAKEFTRVFTTSFILSGDSTAEQFKAMLDSTIGDVPVACFLREILTKLLKLESEAIRWYKRAARAYMLQLADRLEAALGTHDVVTCCSQVPRDGAASTSCAFIRVIVEEERALKHMLFSMPEIHGGVPVAFLEADETMHFSLDDDGFEVVDVPPPPSD